MLKLTDVHCHVLPNIDDGSESVDMSVKMLEMMQSQGVERVVFTPHFYAHREGSVKHFLDKRKRAYDELMAADPPIKDFLLGAEIAIEHGISKLEHIEQLAYSDTDLILLEFPYRPFENWMLEEVEEITATCDLTPIIAHVHRCLQWCSKENMNRILQLNAIFQFNNEALGNFKEKRFVRSMIKEGYPFLWGSDAHDLEKRKPNWDMLFKKGKKEYADTANELFASHIQ